MGIGNGDAVPGTAISPDWRGARQHHGWQVAFAALAILTLLLQFGFLSRGSLRTWDEALTAERSREMLVTGDWITPHTNFETDFNKPPLYYWLTAPLVAAVKDREWPPRFWSAAFAAGCVLFTALLAAGENRDPRAALFAALALLLNAAWLNKTREALLDSGTIFGALGALYFLTIGRHARLAWLWAGLLAAIGCMIKGPYPLLAWPCAIIGNSGIGHRVWGMEKQRHGMPDRKLFRNSLLVAMTLTAPWYAIQFIHYGWAFPQRAFGYAIVERFATPIEGHTGGWLFYPAAWWREGAPSLILFAAAIAFLAACAWRKKAIPNTPSPIPVLFLVTAAALLVSASKREAYLVYLLPGAAVLTGLAVANISRAKSFLLLPSSFILAFILLPSSFILFRDYDRRLSHSDGSKKIAEEIVARRIPTESIAAIDAPRHAVLYYLDGQAPLIAGKSLDSLNIGSYAIVGKDARTTNGALEPETILHAGELSLVRVQQR
ncbi:hypothetical protein BH09SUM1_BH09SUM1_29580 [soil metagenome]